MAKLVAIKKEQSPHGVCEVCWFGYWEGDPSERELEDAVNEAYRASPAARQFSYLGFEPDEVSKRAGLARWVLGPSV